MFDWSCVIFMALPIDSSDSKIKVCFTVLICVLVTDPKAWIFSLWCLDGSRFLCYVRLAVLFLQGNKVKSIFVSSDLSFQHGHTILTS